MIRRLGLTTLFISSTAFAGPTQDTLLSTFDSSGDYVEARSRTVSDSDLDQAQLYEALRDPRWEVRLQASVVQLWRDNPELAQLRWSSNPGVTRKGTPRFAGEIWRGSDAAPMLLERLTQANESAENRAALVAALSHTKGDWTQALSSLLETEVDSQVREVMADVLRHGEAAHAWTGLELAATDTQARVRAAAIRSIGSREDGDRGAALVIDALNDQDAEVRGEASRASGVLILDDAWNEVHDLLADSDPEVRLHALRALSRIDSERAKQMSELSALRGDPDSKVRRLAERIAQP
jgi:HEAT repeat protein